MNFLPYLLIMGVLGWHAWQQISKFWISFYSTCTTMLVFICPQLYWVVTLKQNNFGQIFKLFILKKTYNLEFAILSIWSILQHFSFSWRQYQMQGFLHSPYPFLRKLDLISSSMLFHLDSLLMYNNHEHELFLNII